MVYGLLWAVVHLLHWWSVMDNLLVGCSTTSHIAKLESGSVRLWDEVLGLAYAVSDWGAALVDNVGRLLDGIVDLVSDLVNLGLSVEVSSHDVISFHEGI